MTARGLGNPRLQISNESLLIAIESDWRERFQEFLLQQRILSFVEVTATRINGARCDVLTLGRADAKHVTQILAEWDGRAGAGAGR